MTTTTTTTTTSGAAGYRPKVPGAQLVRTPLYEETLEMALEMCDEDGILLVTGDPGLGKSSTTEAIMCELSALTGRPGLRIQLGRNPRSLEVLTQILAAFGIRARSHEPAGVLAIQLGDILAEEPRTLWVDEAHHLRTDAFTTIRTIHDRPDCRWMLGLVGTQALFGRLSADQPELLDRVGRRVKFHVLDDEDALLSTLTAFHPLLASCDPGRLLRMNMHGPKGRFRQWEKLLGALVRYAKVEGSLSERVEAVALKRCGFAVPSELTRWLDS